jgi:hypothetical protein
MDSRRRRAARPDAIATSGQIDQAADNIRQVSERASLSSVRSRAFRAGPRVAVLDAMRTALVLVVVAFGCGAGTGCGSVSTRSDGGGGHGGSASSGSGGNIGGHGAGGVIGEGGNAGGHNGGGAGGPGGSAGGHGGGGAGGANVCGACELQTITSSCPADVATVDMCPSEGATCCTAGLQEWRCGNCAAETCHWIQSCSSPGTGGAGGGNGHADGGVVCNNSVPCPSGQTCITGGSCAETCARDGGACPSGTTCQQTSVYCTAGACAAIQVFVCR